MIERKNPGLALLLSIAIGVWIAPAAGADDGASRTRPSSSSSSSSSTSSSVPRTSSSDSKRTAQPRPSGDTAARSRSRSSSPRSRDSDYRRSRGYYPYHSYYYGHGWYPFGWGSIWLGGWWGYGPNVVVIRDADRLRGTRYGALDLDIHPEEAEIWIDGSRIGIADNFDGFPDYLWLPAGDHEIVAYHPGYRTIHREYAVYDGVVIDVDDTMDRGESVHPRDLFDRDTPRRDARVERDRFRRENADEARREEDWRQRREGAPLMRDETAPERPAEARPAQPAEDAESRLTLRVRPEDASIYLDGEFLGLARDWNDFFLSPGAHRLDVVRPGYESIRESVDLEPGERAEISIELEED